ncbi:mechanosensitive ion channel protein [Longibacter salinarum]|uniref:Mechanosensitive ion channel protein n=1 Tax=Longibacter salinarum TaxID=1850348 RepID=A0A2A8CUY6_9BACT|nr:mechanosensitive ion channel family protein [Longibacter salinarum]PEN12525.1 mechanosensitive ion channel protein [Longibacter salinarum]
MEQAWSFIEQLAADEEVIAAVRAALKIGIGFLVARLASHAVSRMFATQTTAHQEILARRVTFYLILGVFCASALSELGFDLGILLGAAGILTVALGFASQTSASNVISGLFLLGEKPFEVGDVIRVGTTTGEVLSVDLLSVKLRTFDNLFVRLPNETMIKSEIVNLQRFPIRRYDLQVGVAYKEDMRAVRDALSEVAEQHPLCLEEPAPMVLFQGYGESSLNFQFSVWASQENYMDVRNSIPAEVKEAFDARGIEIPFPHRTLVPASSGAPFSIQSAHDTADSA